MGDSNREESARKGLREVMEHEIGLNLLEKNLIRAKEEEPHEVYRLPLHELSKGSERWAKVDSTFDAHFVMVPKELQQ